MKTYGKSPVAVVRQNLMNTNNYANALKGFIMKDLDLGIKVSTVGEDDFPELEGKIITIIATNGEKSPGLVVGCNRSLGITIVDANNKNHYWCCMVGPVVPNSTVDRHIDWNDSIDFCVEMIRAGVFDIEEAFTLLKVIGHGGGPDGSTCAYRQ